MIRVRTLGTGVAGTPWYINQYFDGDLTGASAAVSAVHGFFTVLRPSIYENVTFQVQPDVVEVDPSTGKAIDAASVSSTAVVCQNTSNMVPAANNMLLRLGTAGFTRGRRIEGKLYIPGLVVANLQADGTLTAAAVTTFAADATSAFLPASPGSQPALVVWSRVGKNTHAVTAITTWSEMAILKSRRN